MFELEVYLYKVSFIYVRVLCLRCFSVASCVRFGLNQVLPETQAHNVGVLDLDLVLWVHYHLNDTNLSIKSKDRKKEAAGFIILQSTD